MSGSTIPSSMPLQPRHFRRQWYRFAIPSAFAVLAFGQFAYYVPDALWIAMIGLCLSISLCAMLHGGLIVSREGIEWYILHPRWRYRVVPWDAVLDIRKTLFVLHPIRLIVEEGRYERWLWGTPRPDRRMDIEIWPRGYSGGRALWDLLHEYWSSSHHPTEMLAVSE